MEGFRIEIRRTLSFPGRVAATVEGPQSNAWMPIHLAVTSGQDAAMCRRATPRFNFGETKCCPQVPVACLSLVLFLASCSATALYQGPKRPRENVARLYAGYGTKIIHIDDHSCSREERSHKYDVLPGQHAISLTTFDVDNYVLITHTTWTRPTTICLKAQAGHEYTFDRQESLRAFKIVDLTTNKNVPGIDCAAQYDERDVEEWNQRPW